MLGDAVTVGFLFFLGFLALGAGVLTVLRFWLVEGTLDGTVAVCALGALLLGSAFAVKTASPSFIALWLVVVIGGTIGIPALAARGEKNALFQMHEEDIAKYRRALETNPQNWMAWREIGETYMKMNRYDDAIAAYKEAIRISAPDAEKLRRRLNQALDYRAGLPLADTIVCDECEAQTPKGKTCLHCGAALEMNLLEWIFQRENVNDILKPTVVITAGVVASFAVFSALPLEVKAILVVASVIVGGFLIWRMVEDE
jgi:hypothetical protein